VYSIASGSPAQTGRVETPYIGCGTASVDAETPAADAQSRVQKKGRLAVSEREFRSFFPDD
jgi:hypothetical protein